MSKFHDLTRIIPDLHDEEFDNNARMEEHFELFGHWPPKEGKCMHDVHARIRRAMNGATIDVPFDGSAVISSDSELERQRQERYNFIYQATKEYQRQVEMEDKYEQAREAGLILPDKLY